MKSYHQLWEKITAPENLVQAWQRVRSGHTGSEAVQEFSVGLQSRLDCLREKLLLGEWHPSGYEQFRVRDPKPRTISCAPVVDRIVHHALCSVIAPLLESRFIPNSFACRKDKGSHRAALLARQLAPAYPYFLKMDVRKYFDSISQERLLAILLPLFRENPLKVVLTRLVNRPVPGLPSGYGLPIGNLTSQWFANFYLDGLDHFLSNEHGVGRGYIRYMDDMLLLLPSKARCWEMHDAARDWLSSERGLSLKNEATRVAPIKEGIPFLGLRIFEGTWRLQRQRFLRTRRHLALREQQCSEGIISEEKFAQCASAMQGGLEWFGFKNILLTRASGESAASGSNRLLRGGSWNNNASNCRSANRNNNTPSNINNNYGFRTASTHYTAESHPDMPAPNHHWDKQAQNTLLASKPQAQSWEGAIPIRFRRDFNTATMKRDKIL